VKEPTDVTKDPDSSAPPSGNGGADPATATAPATATSGQARPLFYQRPAVLSADRHAGKSLRGDAGYAFAGTTNSVALNIIEFPLAVKHYPIVFTQSDPPAPVAVVGLHDAENLFLAADGSWASGIYVPAYVRRYPFIFSASADGEQFTLCIDEAAEALVDGDARPLFRDGEPSEVLDNALQFCTAYQGQSVATAAFAAALAANNLFVPNAATVTMRTGEKFALGGFQVVDEKRFNDLPDETFLDWRRRGWLNAVYCHLMSFTNWATLVDRVV